MHQMQRMAVRTVVLGAVVLAAAGCTRAGAAAEGAGDAAALRGGRVWPGITVLLHDSIGLVRGKRVGLLTNQTGVDESGRSDIDLLREDPRATRAGVQLVRLFSPEHGIRGTEDRTQIASGVDERTGLPIVSLYTATTIAPPDSTLRDLDVLVFDLQDIGTRTWTYVGNLVYALRAVKRAGKPLVVLDRPAPLTGAHRDGPVLDSALANPEEDAPTRRAQAYALWPFPLRHGMTMGELARFYNEELAIGADLHVVPMQGWRRAMWFDETALPLVRPSPNLPTLTSALVYPALVAFESSNVSVGRGTADAFQRFGAPWLDAPRVARMLNERALPGVRFDVDPFTPQSPGDNKYGGQRIPGVKVVVTDRERVHAGRVGAAILWALGRVHADSLRVTPRGFDLRFGSPRAREALLRGDDPDAVIDADLPATMAFERRVRHYFLYR